MKVFLIDDHPVLRGGLRQLLAERPNITVVGEASTGGAALELVSKLDPDIITMDVHLPDMSGIEAARRILNFLPGAKIVVFSSDASRKLIDEALQAGVCGYVWKQSSADELVRAMETVMTGRIFMSPEVSIGILEDYRNNLREELSPEKRPVSNRDKELLRLIAEGHRNKEIAVELSISPKSVEAYRSRLMKKLGYASSAELVRYAIREGIVCA